MQVCACETRLTLPGLVSLTSACLMEQMSLGDREEHIGLLDVACRGTGTCVRASALPFNCFRLVLSTLWVASPPWLVRRAPAVPNDCSRSVLRPFFCGIRSFLLKEGTPGENGDRERGALSVFLLSTCLDLPYLILLTENTLLERIFCHHTHPNPIWLTYEPDDNAVSDPIRVEQAGDGRCALVGDFHAE